MASVLDILKDTGAVRVGTLTSASVVSFASRVYNVVQEHGSCIVLSQNGANMLDTLTDAGIDAGAILVNEERAKGSDDYRDVTSLLGMIERRNSANPKHGKVTLGAVNVPADGGIYNTDGEIVGFAVEAR